MGADEEVAEARAEAKRARRMSWVWWVQIPIVSVIYWFELVPEKAMLIYLANVSIVANAVSYASKQKAAEAKAAGYDHP